MTILQSILIVVGSIIIGIPLYLYVGKTGRKWGAATVAIFSVIVKWNSEELPENYDEVKDDDPMKVIWPLAIIVFACFSMLAFAVRLCWLAWLVIKAGTKFYWRTLKYCWK